MGKVRRDWFEIFAASECQTSAKAADLGEITASDIVRQAMAKLSTLNIDGPEAVAAATQALNDMHKAGALRVRPPVSHTVTVRTPIKGWNFKPIEGAAIEGTGHLVRASDGASFIASAMSVLWPVQIRDFEFAEGIEWTPQQIAAITDPGHTHDIAAPVGLAGPKASVEYVALAVKEPWIEVEVSVTPEMRNAGWQAWAARDDAGDETMDTIYRAMRPLEPTQEVPFVKGGYYDAADSERYGCHLIWWPDELHIPFFSGEQGSRTLRLHCPTSGMPTYYDVSYDERRPITQEIVDNMERGIQKLINEREEIRSGKAPDALLVADRNARQACERQAGVLGDAANEIARLFEVAKERNALIASLGRSGAAQMDEIALLRQALGAEHLRHKQTCDECMAAEAQIETLRTELMAARDTIARFTAANVPDPPKADPIANAIRPRETDRRRIGG